MTEISVQLPSDTRAAYVSGILAVGDNIVIADGHNKNIKLFTAHGHHLYSVDAKECSLGITGVAEDSFATVGFGYDIVFWRVVDKEIKSQDKCYKMITPHASAIHYNGTYFCVLHRYGSGVSVFDSLGTHVRTFEINDVYGKKVDKEKWDIHSDRNTHNIYVPCWGECRGMLCVSIEGEILWFCDFDGGVRGITEVHGILCVVNPAQKCVNLISKEGKPYSKLLEKSGMPKSPEFISFQENTEKMIISFRFETSVFIFDFGDKE